jgi:hypothetical protein
LFGFGPALQPATAELAPSEHQKPAAAAKRSAAKRGMGPQKPSAAPAARPPNSRSEQAKSTTRTLTHDAPPVLQVSVNGSYYRYPGLSPSEQASDVTAGAQPYVDISAIWDAQQSTALPIANRIYSNADPGVTLPVSVYPRFSPDPPGIDVTGRMILELTISDVGLVERVRTVTIPRNIHEFMLLSAAKAWRFEPARVAGHAVRFRHLMAIPAMR